MSRAFRAIGVHQGHSHTFERRSGQNEEGPGPGKLLGRGGSWKSNRFGLEDGTSPKCKSGGAGDISRIAAGTLHFLECCSLQYSCGWLLRVQIISLTTESTLHRLPPHLSLYAVSPSYFIFLSPLKTYHIYNVSLFILCLP